MHACSTLHVGIGFLLHGHLYSNNSIVNINDIGEGVRALFCLTNNIQCCIVNKRKWHWYFPNGSYVSIPGSGGDIYRLRGPSFVYLHRRNSVTMPTGVFRCVIPDVNGTIQNVYTGIYTEGNGETYSNCSKHQY